MNEKIWIMLLVCIVAFMAGMEIAKVFPGNTDEKPTRDCEVQEQIIYRQQVNSSMTKEAYKHRVTCDGTEQIVKTNRLFPIGSKISKQWVRQ